MGGNRALCYVGDVTLCGNPFLLLLLACIATAMYVHIAGVNVVVNIRGNVIRLSGVGDCITQKKTGLELYVYVTDANSATSNIFVHKQNLGYRC